jgi:integrase
MALCPEGSLDQGADLRRCCRAFYSRARRTKFGAEIRCHNLGWPFGPLFKLLLLTAQNRDELGGMRWNEFDLDKSTWTIPRERAKSNRAHVVHLSAPAFDIIKALRRTGDLVFWATGSTPVSGFSRAKDRIDKLITTQLREETGDPEAEIALPCQRRRENASASRSKNASRAQAFSGHAKLSFPV